MRFWTVNAVFFGFSFCSDAVGYFGRGSFGRRLFRMLLPWCFLTASLLDGQVYSFLDADAYVYPNEDALTWTLLLFFRRECFPRTRMFPWTWILTGKC